MSNSRKKNPILPNCIASSEKADKQKANRKLRRMVRKKLSDADYKFPVIKEISNKWNWSKDGKSYRFKLTEKQLSK